MNELKGGEILEVIRKFIDPCAFVGGGRALAIFKDIESNDTDIYFQSNFTFKTAIKQLIQTTIMRELGYPIDMTSDRLYQTGLELIGTLNLSNGDKIQLVWAVGGIKPYPENIKEVLSRFDLSICQIATEYSFEWRGEHKFITTDAFDATMKNKIVTLNDNLSDFQLDKTALERIPKYKKRFPKFKFPVIKLKKKLCQSCGRQYGRPITTYAEQCLQRHYRRT